MCAYKAYIKSSYSEFYNYNKAVFIPFNIEYITLVPNIICRRKNFADIRKIMPFRTLSNVIPPLQRHS